MDNDCNCTMTCHKVLYEPSLSYAMLSEFNIDQVALTDPARKKAVKEQMEVAMETQQRVVVDIRDQDEEVMGYLVSRAAELQTSMATMTTLLENTTLLANTYGMVDIFNIHSIPVSVTLMSFFPIFCRLYIDVNKSD